MLKCPIKLAVAIAFIAGVTLLIEHRKEVKEGIEKFAAECRKNCHEDSTCDECNEDETTSATAENTNKNIPPLL